MPGVLRCQTASGSSCIRQLCVNRGLTPKSQRSLNRDLAFSKALTRAILGPTALTRSSDHGFMRANAETVGSGLSAPSCCIGSLHNWRLFYRHAHGRLGRQITLSLGCARKQ
ncbi:hypothetical protein Cthiooxydans_17910 [Comamonas thiooxydans]|nr:hypothetical protein Cthiooxydans_17910 [Comamonas thiooxydans]